MLGFDTFVQLQGRKFIDIVYKCSAHNIDYGGFKIFKYSFLPLNLTSHLQPVDAAVGC